MNKDLINTINKYKTPYILLNIKYMYDITIYANDKYYDDKRYTGLTICDIIYNKTNHNIKILEKFKKIILDSTSTEKDLTVHINISYITNEFKKSLHNVYEHNKTNLETYPDYFCLDAKYYYYQYINNNNIIIDDQCENNIILINFKKRDMTCVHDRFDICSMNKYIKYIPN